MALMARLQLGDNGAKRYAKEYLVTDFKCHVQRPHNTFRPDQDVRCERLELTVVVPGRDDLSLLEWYVNGESHSGRVLIELSSIVRNGADIWKEVLFEDAVCFAISEDYHIDNNKRRELKLGLVSEYITVDDHQFKQ